MHFAPSKYYLCRPIFLSNRLMRTKLSQFSFELPEKLIAKYPSKERDESRMMVINRKTGLMENKTFKDILEYFDDGDCMVFNNTKVFPARLYGKKEKTDAEIEVFLLRELNAKARLWDVLVDPARKIRVGNKLYFLDKKGNEILVAEPYGSSSMVLTKNLVLCSDPKDRHHYLNTSTVKQKNKIKSDIRPSTPKKKALWLLQLQDSTSHAN